MAVVNLPVEYLVPHPQNPRKELGDLTELTKNIKENGIYQNLTVVPVNEDKEGEEPKYMVLIGHRRLAAAKAAGLKEVPCAINRKADEREQLQIMLEENMQRTDLTILEQAQGFQQLLDFGVNIETISQKSGFSQTTIRRRLEIAKLDQKKLKEVSTSRQLSLTDFDELTKIKDIELRNKALESIGTRDFQWAVKSAVRDEKLKVSLPELEAIMKQMGAKLLNDTQRYTSKYESLGTKVRLEDWENTKQYIPDLKGKQLYYYANQYGELAFYKRHENMKGEKTKESAAALERKKRVSEAWFKVKAMATAHYELRKSFIERLKPTAKSREKILEGAYTAAVAGVVDYSSMGRDRLSDMCGIETMHYDKNRVAKALAFLDNKDLGVIKQAVYTLFNDDEKNSSADGYSGDYPKYKLKGNLAALYKWLELLGYERSDEEELMLTGKHEVFQQDMFEGGE